MCTLFLCCFPLKSLTDIDTQSGRDECMDVSLSKGVQEDIPKCGVGSSSDTHNVHYLSISQIGHLGGSQISKGY